MSLHLRSVRYRSSLLLLLPCRQISQAVTTTTATHVEITSPVTTPLTSGPHMQATYYATGTGACGYTDNDSLPIVAISHLIYGNGGNCNQVCPVIRSLWKAWSQFWPYLYSGSRSRTLPTASHSTGTSATNARDALNMTSVSSSMVHVIRNSDHDSCCQISALHFFRALGRI